METSIFGRAHELKILNRLYQSKKPEFLAIYGRRRVGKTYLIHEYFKNKGLYFCVTGSADSSKKLQLRKFYRELLDTFPQLEGLKEPVDWDEALFALKKAVEEIETTKKVILFFDELPWLASNRSGFLQALEYIWNQYFSRQNNVIVIVCGSAANWIIKKVIHNKKGLYGRLSEIIKLNPFTLAETEQFLASQQVRLSRKQIVELYMAIGGVAKYLTYIQPGDSVAQAINRLCFTSQGPLITEFNNLYRSLFDDSHKHVQIIKALAKKKSGLFQRDLLDDLGISSGGQATSILEELEESGFIAMSSEFSKKSRDKKIWLIDEYSYFYMSWIEPVKSPLIVGNDRDYWLKMQHDPKWKTWSGYAFESICFKHIAQIKKKLGIAAVLTFESQWSYRPKGASERGAQIDLIIDRKDDCINLCEIKFYHTEFTIDRSYAQELQHKIETFRERTKTKKTLFLTLITPYGLRQNEHSIGLVSNEIVLEDFFIE